MCMCCGILETLALCVGVKVLAVCRKKKCDCPRPHTDSKKIEVINLETPVMASSEVKISEQQINPRKL